MSKHHRESTHEGAEDEAASDESEKAALDVALKSGEEPLELRVSNLEEMLKSVIKQNCLRIEGGR